VEKLMKRLCGYLAVILAVVGLAGCTAGLIGIWVARPYVLHSSAEILEAADDGLKLVDDKATRAGELVARMRAIVDPVAGRILKLADKAAATPEDEKELQRIEGELAERLRQVDAIAEVAETAVGFLNRTSRLTRSLPWPSRIATGPAADDSRDTVEMLAKFATKLRSLRESLAKMREDKQFKREVVDTVVGVARDVSEDLTLVDTKLQRVRQKAIEWRPEVAELRITVPVWTNWAAVIGSLILAWLGLGQFVLLRRAWAWSRPERPA
jgi:hypothetical protein